MKSKEEIDSRFARVATALVADRNPRNEAEMAEALIAVNKLWKLWPKQTEGAGK
jgi:hypothetical protein